MSTPPLLTREPPPPSFNLPVSGYVTWGAYAALRLLVLGLRKTPLEEYAISGLLGELVAMLVLPGVCALIVWRLAGRSAKAGNVTFFVVFALALLSQCSQFAQKVRDNAEMSRIVSEQQQLNAEQRAALNQGRAINTDKSLKLAEQAENQLDVMAKNSTGHDRDLAEGVKGFLSEVLAAKHRYDAAFQSIHTENFWQLETYASTAVANDRRRAVRAFAQANTELTACQDQNATAMRRVLAAHGASAAEVQSAVSGYLSTAGSRIPILLKIRECDAQLAQVMLDFIDLADASRGQWHLNPTSGKIVFHDQPALTRYTEVMKRLQAISAAQTAYQKQAFAVQH